MFPFLLFLIIAGRSETGLLPAKIVLYQNEKGAIN
jgi:hypothetical protein